MRPARRLLVVLTAAAAVAVMGAAAPGLSPLAVAELLILRFLVAWILVAAMALGRSVVGRPFRCGSSGRRRRVRRWVRAFRRRGKIRLVAGPSCFRC
jgi:hypothetical protein